MAISRKTESNRRNAARSTGPRTRAGKERSSLNAVAHGLSATPTFDVQAQKRIEYLTKMFMQKNEGDPLAMELAAEAAEAQVMLERVRELKNQVWENTARNPVITDHGTLYDLNDPLVFSVFSVRNYAAVHYVKNYLPHMMAEPYVSEAERDAAIVELATKTLKKYIRYERKAANRRDRALRDLEKRR